MTATRPTRPAGFVLVAVAMLLALIALMALMLNRESVVSTKRASGETELQQLRFVAAAGLEHALWAANQGKCRDYKLDSTSFGKHRYEASFTPTQGSPVTIDATGTLASGLSRTVVSATHTVYQEPTQTTIQPDAENTHDTFVDATNPDWNHGTSKLLQIRGGGRPNHALLRFSPDKMPDGARLVSAVLELHSESVSASGTISAHRITAGWTEGRENADEPDDDGVTWEERADAEPWRNAGGDYDPSPLATTHVAAPAGSWHGWEITSVAGDWLTAGGGNNGVILVPADPTVAATFQSSDSGKDGLQPRLILSYACECGIGGETGSAVLQPGGAAGQDTHIHSTETDSNYGSHTVLNIENTQRGLLKFDLSAIPANALITSASLIVDATAVVQPGVVGAHRLTTAWDEQQATWLQAGSAGAWTNAGGDFDPVAADTKNVTTLGKYAFDVTAIAATWTPGSAENNGVLLKGQSAVELSFASSDLLAADRRPSLTLEFSCPCGADCSVGGGGPDSGQYCEADFEALSKEFDFKWAPDANDVTGIDFLPEGAVANGTTVPAGGGWIMADAKDQRFLVTDASGAPLTDFPSNISDARGVAYVESGTWTGHLAVADKDDAVYYVDLDGVVAGSFSTAGIATEPYGVSFIGETLGHIYDGHLAISSHKDGAGDAIGAVYIVDQSGVLKRTINVDAHAEKPRGVAHLRGQDKLMVSDHKGVVSIMRFAGTLLNQYDTATWGLANMQGVTINPETCKHIVIAGKTRHIASLSDEPPTGGKPNLLMVVANPSDLKPTELAKKALFESWRYTVSLIDDSAAASQYATAVNINDVAYVGEDISAGSLGSKLAGAAIGVVNEEPNLIDEFGLSGGIGWSNDRLLNIDDNGHHITRPFALGPLTILTADSDLAHSAGMLAPDLRTLGSGPAGLMLLTLPAVGEQIDTIPAAGRRVQLPWGGSNFDVGDLTGDGLEILRRSLEWGAQPPGRCNADFVPNRLEGQFPWMPETGDLQGIDYLPPATVINAVTVPAGGGWIFNDKNKDRLFVSDPAGNPLTDFPVPAFDTQGVALIEAGLWVHHLAVVDKDNDLSHKRVYYLTPGGEIETSFRLRGLTTNPLGLDFVGATAGGIYDNHLVISTDKDADSDEAVLHIVDQSGSLKKTLDIEAFAPKPVGVAHLTGADKFLVTDEDGLVSIVDFEGVLLRQYSATAFGLTKPTDAVIDPITCAHVIVDRDTKTIASLNFDSGGGGGGPAYVETHSPWRATTEDAWETAELGILGVPGKAVVEVAIVNQDGGKALWGGVRAAGSVLERRLRLHEAGGGGADVAVMHVQADAAGRIEHYSDDPDKLGFVLLGYWTGSGYVESWAGFKAGGDASWLTHTLDSYGVGTGDAAEILLINNDALAEHRAGVRTGGSALERTVTLHEAADGGNDTMTAIVVAGAGTEVEVYAGDDARIDFRLAGYWSVPPGTYTSAFSNLGRPSAEALWEAKNLGAYGVPANAVTQIAPVNSEPGAESMLGVRSNGSGLIRVFELHEAENGGDDLASMHVRTDSGGAIQWYVEHPADLHRFYLLGWWQAP